MVLVFSGCPKNPPSDLPLDVPDERVGDTQDEEEELDIIGSEFQSVEQLVVVRFEFDKFDLTDDAKEKLQGNADFLKGRMDLEVLVEGHCDEHGTNEYNLALGQRRAKVVRDYYIRLGIDGGRIGTISFGEEKPVNPDCGNPLSMLCAENRRAETKVRRPSAAMPEETEY